MIFLFSNLVSEFTTVWTSGSSGKNLIIHHEVREIFDN